jgi:hypothetical protein
MSLHDMDEEILACTSIGNGIFGDISSIEEISELKEGGGS